MSPDCQKKRGGGRRVAHPGMHVHESYILQGRKKRAGSIKPVDVAALQGAKECHVGQLPGEFQRRASSVATQMKVILY